MTRTELLDKESPSDPFQDDFPLEKDYFSTRETAKMLGLSVGTVQKMVDGGKLEAWTTGGGHRRIRADSVRAFLGRTGQKRATSAPDWTLSVLIAEDEPVQCRIYEAGINGWGLPLELRIVPDGFAALIEAGRKPPDVMLVDLLMPGMDGFQLIRHLRADPAFKETSLMVITSMDAQEIEARGGLPLDVPVIRKPASFEILYGFIRASLGAKGRNHSWRQS